MTKIIALSSNQGDVLQPSLSINLAYAIVENKKKVLIVDLDNNGGVAKYFGKDTNNIEFTIYDLLVNSEELSDPHYTIQNMYPGLDIIGTSEKMAYIEIEILTKLNKYPQFFNILSESLNNFYGEYDYIFLDEPPALGLMAANVFNCINEIVIPSQTEQPYEYRTLIKTLEAIKGFKQTNSHINISQLIPEKGKNNIVNRSYMDTAKMIAKMSSKEENISYSPIVIPESINYTEFDGRYNVPITSIEDVSKSREHYKKDYYNLAKNLGYIDQKKISIINHNRK